MNIKPTLNYAADTSLDDLYTVKRANEWITAAKVRPVPKMLFGECWLEGEMALLTSPAGAGKSLLAVQIAESIARGRYEIEPFPMMAAAQPVLYFDLKLSDKQFEVRYAADAEPEDEFLKKHYRFSDRFHRVEVDMTKELPKGAGSWAELLPRLIKKLATEKKAKVIIIDDITSLQTSVYGYRETPPLMKELNRLKREMGLSILVLANDPGRDVSRTPTSLRLLDRFVDSVFTIGQSKGNAEIRYIKQLRSRSTDIMYDPTHVPSFLVGRSDDSFLGFDLLMYDNEKTINDIRDDPDWPMIDRIKSLADEGKTIRQIAEILGESKTKVHRWLQLWEPEEEPQEAAAAAGEERRVSLHDTKFPEDVPKNSYDFPGCEEFDEVRKELASKGMETEDPESRSRGREYYLMDVIRADARQAYLATGKAPTLAEMVAGNEELRRRREARGIFDEGPFSENNIKSIDPNSSPPGREGCPGFAGRGGGSALGLREGM